MRVGSGATLALTIGVVSTSGAQTGPPAFAIDTAKINTVFAAYAGNASPGCAAGVYREGKVVFARGYGMADLERGVPITPETLFDLGSTSKQFTAASIALLAADGRLAFGDDVRRHVPEVPDYGTPITIDHLVRHTSGLRDYIGLLVLGGRRIDDASDDDEAIAAISRQRALNFAPGAEWSYSNSGFFLLSVIVKRVTGQTLAEFARERIFQPLEMTRTGYRDDHLAILPGRALAYSPGDDGRLRHDVPNWDQLGDGAVWSSIEELVRWDRNFADPRVGGARLVTDLTEPGRLNDGSAHSYGRGLFLDRYRGLERVHHGGSWGGFRAMLMRFPSERTSVAVLCNVGTANTQALAEGVADVVLAGRLSEPVATAEPAAAPGDPAPEAASIDTSRYAGLYFSDAEQAVVRVMARGGALFASALGTTLRLAPSGDDRFAVRRISGSVTFSGPAGSPARTLELVVRGTPQGTYQRVAPVAPRAADLAGYAGRYYSAELDATYTIVLEADSLRLVSRTLGRPALEPAMADAFVGPAFVRFTRDGRRRISGFEMTISRVKRLAFERRP